MTPCSVQSKHSTEQEPQQAAREVPEARQQVRAKEMETKAEKATETEQEAQSRMKEPESDRSRRCAAISE